MPPKPASELRPGDVVHFDQPLNAIVVETTAETDDLIRIVFAVHRLLTETLEVL